jgi:uncharacterized protein YeeX (DUF496 family)|tara:strand:+ start:809 stop:1501 length:693 start_codon:yes stop_codon:yes gene_type:complete
MLRVLKNIINQSLLKFGFRISKVNNTDELVKIYQYKNYDEYKETQIFYNKKKINHIWADEETLNIISNFIKENINKENINGLCHGSRNGFEQEFFNNNIKNAKVVGTDISETASKFKNSVVWDFHKINDRWLGNFDFIYTNSLDQSYDPKLALTTWLGQININGYIIIEHSDQHGVRSSGKMDPFGVEANYFPYLLSDWFGHSISVKIIRTIKRNKASAPAWFFIIKKVN